jgi:hypothetical protein
MQASAEANESEGVDREGESPTPSTFSILQELDQYTDKLWKTMVYFIGLCFFLMITLLWASYGLNPISEWLFVPYVFYGGIIVIYFPVAFLNGIGLLRPLKRWRDVISDVVFEITFELLPTKGDAPLDRILNKISELYTDIPELLAERPGAIRRDVGLGKKKSVRWDIVIDLAYPRFPKLLAHVIDPEYILVKRIVSEKEVGVGEVRGIIEGVRKDLKWSSAEIVHIFVVSTADFTDDVVSYAADVCDKVNFDIELVVEKGTGYELALKVDYD